ncbi:MAG: dTDP-4-dehydrorhamnose reductase [Candidatus Gastranaerophilales bacterium]|nr:dTDP-4-dehydrorhamnose reductase [Candidatus Gastranaerophilales bacterium]
MKVLVTGANGMLGKDLCPYLEELGVFVIQTDCDTMDITNFEQTKEAIEKIRPNLIIHCAAYTNVDKAEEDLETATKINVDGSRNVAIAAQNINATMVYISTDYVFDGTKKEPYLPTDKPNPINNYGLTKYQGELEVQKHCEKHYIARTSWLYGIHGKNFVETMIALADINLLRGDESPKEPIKPITVVDDQKGCPTWTIELIQGILKLLNKPYGIYHVCGSGKTTWYGFAKEIFNQKKLNVNLKPCKTEDFPRPAKRPSYSVMENEGITRDWKEALGDYLKLRKEY